VFRHYIQDKGQFPEAMVEDLHLGVEKGLGQKHVERNKAPWLDRKTRREPAVEGRKMQRSQERRGGISGSKLYKRAHCPSMPGLPGKHRCRRPRW
jgi:hypothetical protein